MVLAHLSKPDRSRDAAERKPDFCRPRRKHLRRHHADDGVKLAAKVEGASQDAGIAVENSLPKPVADHRHQGPARSIFLLGENAPELRL